MEAVEKSLGFVDKTGDHPRILQISARTGEGIKEFEETVRELFLSGKIRVNPDAMLTNVRHHACVSEALKSLQLVFEAVKSGVPEDLYTVDLMDAYSSLGKILGEEVGDDLVDTIFSKFCMGK